MKKFAIVPAAVGVVAGLVLGVSGGLVTADNGNGNGGNIVGVWEVDAAAPYRPHLFTFNADGTMISANPTNVQESPNAPHGGTNDSLGQGVWTTVNVAGTKYVEGTFEELNAFADNHQPTDTLSVSFKLQMTNNDQGFDGPASATLAGQTFPSHLTGVRVNIDQAAVDAL
ncbi:MAG TPA: hypothetical protein VLF91_03650 [Candidatus Saccharimonadales bacterium]|nr:hypothetical protein [Candidatus Saccharimonadales bacterium]